MTDLVAGALWHLAMHDDGTKQPPVSHRPLQQPSSSSPPVTAVTKKPSYQEFHQKRNNLSNHHPRVVVPTTAPPSDESVVAATATTSDDNDDDDDGNDSDVDDSDFSSASSSSSSSTRRQPENVVATAPRRATTTTTATRNVAATLAGWVEQRKRDDESFRRIVNVQQQEQKRQLQRHLQQLQLQQPNQIPPQLKQHSNILRGSSTSSSAGGGGMVLRTPTTKTSNSKIIEGSKRGVHDNEDFMDQQRGALTLAKLMQQRDNNNNNTQQQQQQQQQQKSQQNQSSREQYYKQVFSVLQQNKHNNNNNNNNAGGGVVGNKHSNNSSSSFNNNTNNNNNNHKAANRRTNGFSGSSASGGGGGARADEMRKLNCAVCLTVVAVIAFCALPFFGLPLLQAARRKSIDVLVMPDFDPFPVNFGASEYFFSKASKFPSLEESSSSSPFKKTTSNASSSLSSSPPKYKQGWLNKVQKSLFALHSDNSNNNNNNHDGQEDSSTSVISFFKSQHVAAIVALRGRAIPSSSSSSLLPFSLVQSLAQVPPHMPFQVVFSLSPSASKAFDFDKKKFHSALMNTIDLTLRAAAAEETNQTLRQNQQQLKRHPLLGSPPHHYQRHPHHLDHLLRRSEKNESSLSSSSSSASSRHHSALHEGNYQLLFSTSPSSSSPNANKVRDSSDGGQGPNDHDRHHHHHLSHLYQAGLQRIAPSAGTVLFLSDSIAPVNPQTFIFHLVAEFSAVRPFTVEDELRQQERIERRNKKKSEKSSNTNQKYSSSSASLFSSIFGKHDRVRGGGAGGSSSSSSSSLNEKQNNEKRAASSSSKTKKGDNNNNDDDDEPSDEDFFDFSAQSTQKYSLTSISAMQCGVVHHPLVPTDSFASREKLYDTLKQRIQKSPLFDKKKRNGGEPQQIHGTQKGKAKGNNDEEEGEEDEESSSSLLTVSDKIRNAKIRKMLLASSSRRKNTKEKKKGTSDSADINRNHDDDEDDDKEVDDENLSRQIWHELYSSPDLTVVDGGWQVGVSTPPGRDADPLHGVSLFSTWHGFTLRSAGFQPPLLTRDEELAQEQRIREREEFGLGADTLEEEAVRATNDVDDDDDEGDDENDIDDDNKNRKASAEQQEERRRKPKPPQKNGDNLARTGKTGKKSEKEADINSGGDAGDDDIDPAFLFGNAKAQQQQQQQNSGVVKTGDLMKMTSINVRDHVNDNNNNNYVNKNVNKMSSSVSSSTPPPRRRSGRRRRRQQKQKIESHPPEIPRNVLVDDELDEEADELPVLVDALGSNCIIIDRQSLHDAGAFAPTTRVQSDVDQLVSSSEGWEVANLHLSQLFLFDVTTVFMSLMTSLMGKSVTGVTVSKRRQARGCISVGVDAVAKFEDVAGISTSVLAMRWGIHNRPWRVHYADEVRSKIVGCENNTAFVDVVLCYCDMVRAAGQHLVGEIKDAPTEVKQKYPVPDATPGWSLSMRLRSLSMMSSEELEIHRARGGGTTTDSNINRNRESSINNNNNNENEKSTYSSTSPFAASQLSSSIASVGSLHNAYRVGCSRSAIAFSVIPSSEATTSLLAAPQWTRIFLNHVVAPSYQLFAIQHQVFNDDWIRFSRGLHAEYNRVIVAHQLHHFDKKSKSSGVATRSWWQSVWSSKNDGGGDGFGGRGNDHLERTWNKPWRISWTHRHSLLAMFARRKHSLLVSKWGRRELTRDGDTNDNGTLSSSSSLLLSSPPSSSNRIRQHAGGEDGKRLRYFEKKKLSLIPALRNSEYEELDDHRRRHQELTTKAVSSSSSSSSSLTQQPQHHSSIGSVIASSVASIFSHRHRNNNNNNNNKKNHDNSRGRTSNELSIVSATNNNNNNNNNDNNNDAGGNSDIANGRWGQAVAWTPSDLARMPFIRVVWFAICCGCCGFSAEIAHFTRPLSHLYPVNLLLGPDCFCPGYESGFADALGRAHLRPDKYGKLEYYPGEVLVWISHTDPMSFKRMDFFHRRRPSYIVGRSMYEFTRIPIEWEHPLRSNSDEIWVPSEFVYQTFADAGAPKHKMRIVPEGIDTRFFDPSVHRPLRIGKRVNVSSPGFRKRFGINWNNVKCNRPPYYSSSSPKRKMKKEGNSTTATTTTTSNENKYNNNNNNNNNNNDNNKDEYIFFSQFKWEPRKGWRALFESYFRAFAHKKFRKSMTASHAPPEFFHKKSTRTRTTMATKTMKKNQLEQREQEKEDANFDEDPDVSLIVLSILYSPDINVKYTDNHDSTVAFRDIEALVANLFPDNSTRPTMEELPRFCLIMDGVSEREMAQLFRGADAFVLPTRGEGWGLPTMQAMSMGLPVISTNWGGTVDFTTKDTSFLIELDAVEEIPRETVYGWRDGKKWATPSVRDLTRVLRYVYSNREHAIEVGERARQFIVRNFDDFEVVRIVDRRLQEIAFSQRSKSFWDRH